MYEPWSVPKLVTGHTRKHPAQGRVKGRLPPVASMGIIEEKTIRAGMVGGIGTLGGDLFTATNR